MSYLGQVVNFNNGVSRVRAFVIREDVDPDDDSRVFLHGPDHGGENVVLIRGEKDDSKPFGYRGIPRRSPADYEAGGGGGLTWHTTDEEE